MGGLIIANLVHIARKLTLPKGKSQSSKKKISLSLLRYQEKKIKILFKSFTTNQATRRNP